MTAYDTLPDAVTEIFGEEATAGHSYDLLTVDVPIGSWIAALEIARDKLGCTYFDWLSAVDEPGTGFQVCAHVVALENRRVRRLLIRTTVPHSAPVVPTAVEIYAGAAWHERETHEMFGVDFTDHPHLVPLLLPDGFEGHPLRKDFVLAARVAKAWPGAKEPGESDHGGPKRRQMLPPGVPDPNEWGPLKGQLPPAQSRPTRTPRAGAAGAGAGAAGAAAADRPARRARSVSAGSASQALEAPVGPQAQEAPVATEVPQTPAPDAPQASVGKQVPEATQPPATEASAPGAAAEGDAQAGPLVSAPEPPPTPAPAAEPPPPRPTPPARSTDTPWHNARDADPAEEADATPDTEATEVTAEADSADSADSTESAGSTDAEADRPADERGSDA
ncbi:NADH-quinone oxidoreductase subunit C [Streptomyces sp. H27-C3]|uniref:NADH-quinone oxidoreductase subunit C n=1 Tax=Streptomyces sp. H27-C3 TaxID=3046305 RepID=UPI0024B9C121|nr:NADH-quinone oxidoreductase subunit C [Streptomyces sp. H27-C3]MDJ0464346.1 NADH-quinone oxidoreductase subunit C [Streptomyces sp. H27-C3]